MERLVDRKRLYQILVQPVLWSIARSFITIFTENGTIEVLISEKQMSKRRQVV